MSAQLFLLFAAAIVALLSILITASALHVGGSALFILACWLCLILAVVSLTVLIFGVIVHVALVFYRGILKRINES